MRGRPLTRSLVPVFGALDLTYLALRAGPVDSTQLIERLGSCAAANRLVRMGHASARPAGWSTVYRLTAAGLAACPSRRALEGQVTPAYGGGVIA